MLTDADCLLEACFQNRAEDTCRLALADELEQIGWGDAARYVRAEIALSRGSRDPRLAQERRRAMRGYAVWLAGFMGDGCVGLVHSRLELIMYWPAWNGTGNYAPTVRIATDRGLPSRIGTQLFCVLADPGRFRRLGPTEVKISDRFPERDRLWHWVSVPWPQKWNTWIESAHQIPAPIARLLMQPNRRYARAGDAHADLEQATMKYLYADENEPAQVD